jgi:hypothetical protein
MQFKNDMNLGYFRFVQYRIKHIKSGDILTIDDEGCLDMNNEKMQVLEKIVIEGKNCYLNLELYRMLSE